MPKQMTESCAKFVHEMIELREAGKTFREIGERYGVSRQRVQYLLSRDPEARANVARKRSVDIEKIVYDGIYRAFKNDKRMTFTKFATIFYGRRGVDRARVQHVTTLITTSDGHHASICQIKRVCDYIGEPFESVFALRR